MRVTFSTTHEGGKVESAIDVPNTASGWIKESGFSDEELAGLIIHAFKVVEAQPEIRDAKPKTAAEASKIAQARFAEGPRERQARGVAARAKKDAELKEAGFDEKAREMYWKMQEALK